MTIEPLNINPSEEKTLVEVYYDGKKYGPIPKDTSIESIRAALQKVDPAVANAKITQDPQTGDFTVTRSAGEKGN